MRDESFVRFNIKYIRKILRVTDLFHLRNDELYKIYYQYILKKLNDVLSYTWKEYTTLRTQNVSSKNNKKIWVMWWQGYDQAPKVIKRNIKNLRQLFGDNVIVIDQTNYLRYTNISNNVQNAFNQKHISFTQWSDIIRYNLLRNHGGLWVDSSVMISEKIKSIPDFFESDFISLVSRPNTSKFITQGQWTGWFIGGEANFGLFVFLDLFFKNYYQKYRETIDYFFADDAATYYLNKDKKFRDLLKKQSREWNPYSFIENYNSLNSNHIINEFKNNQSYCIQKITYKFDYNKAKEGSLAYKIGQGEIL